MNWYDTRIKIRRFLRDPDGNIWSDAMIKRVFNDCQREIQQKTSFLEDIQVVNVPPTYDQSYLYDWEWTYLPSGHGPCYQAGIYVQQAEICRCYNWEHQAVYGLDSDSSGEGSRFIHPWEAWASSPCDIVPLRFPAGFYSATMVAWDKEPIDYLDLKEISSDDSTWKTRFGATGAYWRPDELEHTFCLYPVPSSPVWDDEEIIPQDAVWAVAHSWENSTTYFTVAGVQFTRNHAATSTDYVFNWENAHLNGENPIGDDLMRGMWVFEIDPGILGYNEGMVITVSGVTTSSEVGVIDNYSPYIFNQDLGIVTEIVDPNDNVLFVFQKEPTDMENDTDEVDWPSFLQKYIEYATLERLYSADTDGKIESLRDYWGNRKSIGIEVIKRYMSKRREDRDYRLITKGAPMISTAKRYPKLPDEYPAM